MTVTLKIDKTVYGGDGLGRLADGRVCFVKGAFAGETVRAEITEQRKRFVRARLEGIEEAIPERCEPGLTVPGMVYSAVSYEAEIRFKQDQLENFLWKVDSRVLPLEVVPASNPLNYRNKAVYHVERQDGKWIIGYRAEPEYRVVDVTSDPLACAGINAALPEVRAGAMALLSQGARSVRRSARSSDSVTVRWTPADGAKWWLGNPPVGLELHERTCGRRFRVPAGGFYQVNPEMCEKLASAVHTEYIAGAERAPDVLDLYCGVGMLGICCAPPRIVGIEAERASVACAKRNAQDAGIDANFFCERVGGSLSRIKVGPRHTVLLDPPRGGLEPNVAGWLANRPAPRILCASCDPATLVRDLAGISKSYSITKVILLDMFPRTARFETLVVLDRRNNGQ